MCVFSAAKLPKKHTLVLFEAASGGLKKNILFRTRYLGRILLTSTRRFRFLLSSSPLYKGYRLP